MGAVTMTELRNQIGEVLDRVAAGECLTVKRGGRPVAELHPAGRPRLRAEELLQRWSGLPSVDPAALRADIDRVVNTAL